MIARTMVSLVLLTALSAFTPCLPAQGQAAPGGGISVDSFTDDAKGPLKGGDVLHVTLQGTRNGRATFAIPGLTESVTMKEGAPGTYTGSYTVPKNVSIASAALVGRLSYPGIESPLVPADNALTLDSIAPRVVFVSPSKGSTVESARPLVYAALSDVGGVGVDPASVRIVIDGADLTSQAAITPFSVAVTPSLTPGAHTIAVSVADLAKNTGTAQCQFTVEPTQLVSSFGTDTAPGQSIVKDRTIRFTLNAQTGGQGKVNIVGVASNIPVVEGRPGVYTGEYTVRPGDDALNVPAVALFRASNGRTVAVPLSDGLTIAAGPPLAPRITDPPIDDVEAGDTISLMGAAPPGATILVTVNYVSKATGGLLPINGVAGVQEVMADGKGIWQVEDISLALRSLLGHSQNTAFLITAVTVVPNGDISAPAKLSVRRGE